MPPQKSGRSTDDLRRDNERVIRQALEIGLRAAFSPPDATPPISRIPAFDDQVAPPRKIERMSENNGNGTYYPALKADVDNLKLQYHDLKNEIETKFSGLSSELRDMVRSIENRIERSKPDIGKFANVAGILVTVALFGIGGFAAYVKSNIEGSVSDLKGAIRDTNMSMAAQNKDMLALIVKQGETTAANFTSEERTIRDATSTAIPRAELDYRINGNRDMMLNLARKIDENVVPRTEFEKRADTILEDIRTLKGDTLKREDIDGRFADFTKRLDLISNRVEILQRNSASSAVLQEQVREISAQVAELRSRLLVPSVGRSVQTPP